ncbi:hypothetical protein NECAME_06185 [Necator americanus]|uniref:Uncharacterized protein n=1 Tax=Necator americanus TaxID=51031 RepID=W2TXV2_NECAM|nr:hypothetical protein NECAME_06185 [Necator americanus]ETN85871.1 hypothetical protein NECAME_06185 [Necator americanus]
MLCNGIDKEVNKWMEIEWTMLGLLCSVPLFNGSARRRPYTSFEALLKAICCTVKNLFGLLLHSTHAQYYQQASQQYFPPQQYAPQQQYPAQWRQWDQPQSYQSQPQFLPQQPVQASFYQHKRRLSNYQQNPPFAYQQQQQPQQRYQLPQYQQQVPIPPPQFMPTAQQLQQIPQFPQQQQYNLRPQPPPVIYSQPPPPPPPLPQQPVQRFTFNLRQTKRSRVNLPKAEFCTADPVHESRSVNSCHNAKQLKKFLQQTIY